MAAGRDDTRNPGRPLRPVRDRSPALPSIADTAERAVLLALAEAERERRALNLSPQSRAYAPRVLKQLCPDSMDVVRVEDIERAVLALERRGAIKPTTFRDGSRN